MALPTYEPPTIEISLTLALGLTVLSPYYRGFARSLNLRGDERVLDFGSGSGICSRHIAARLQSGGHIDCVDISDSWMEVIRKTLQRYDNIGYYPGHITELALPKSAYDLVVVHYVLHDIPAAERQGVINALARLLKPAGRLVLREPQGEGLKQEEIIILTIAAGLFPKSFSAPRIAIGAVYDACFTREKEIR